MTTKRTKMAKNEGKRRVFTGTFARIGKKHGSKSGATILLTDVKNYRGDIVTEHLWVNYTKGIARLDSLFPGDVLKFKARVKVYKHAKEGIRDTKKGALLPDDYYEEYGLSHPTDFKLVTKVIPPKGKERQEISWMADRQDFQSRINKFAKWWTYYLNREEKG